MFLPPGTTLSKALTSSPSPQLTAAEQGPEKQEDHKEAPVRRPVPPPVEAAPGSSKVQVSDMEVPLFDFLPAQGEELTPTSTSTKADVMLVEELDEKAFAEHHAGIEALAENEFFNDTRVLSR